MELQYEFLFEIEATLGKTQNIGDGPHGHRTILPVTRGSFRGPKLSGELLPVGADWLTNRLDNVRELDVRATMRTDDGELIYVHYRGVIDASPQVWDRYYKGEAVNPSEYYFRTTPVFETGSVKYRWLNNIVSVGIGEMTRDGVKYRVFRIL